MKHLTTRFLILCLALTAWPAFAQNLVSDQDPLTSLAEDDVLYVVDNAGAYDGKVDVSVLRSELLKQRGGANLQTGTSYTLVLSDAGKVVELANASAITLTIPANSATAFPVNTVIELVQGGAGDVTIGITDDTLNGKTSITNEWTSVLLWKRAATEWVSIAGDPGGLSESEVDARVVAVASGRRTKTFFMDEMRVAASQSPSSQGNLGHSTSNSGFPVRSFDDTAVEAVFFSWRVPDNYDESEGWRFIVAWSPSTTNSGDAYFEIRPIDYAEGDAIDVQNHAGGTPKVADTSLQVVGDIQYTAESSEAASGSLLTKGRNAVFRLQRFSNQAEDTLSGDISIISASIVYYVDDPAE